MLLAGKVARDTDLLQSGYTQGTLLNRSRGFFLFYFLISRKQRVGKQKSPRTAGSLSKEWMAEHEVLTHPFDERTSNSAAFLTCVEGARSIKCPVQFLGSRAFLHRSCWCCYQNSRI